VVSVFTGLVEDLGTVAAIDQTGDGARVTISTSLAHELASGDSISVNGVCLTAVLVGDDSFGAFVMGETLRRSSLNELRAGAGVNLELPVKVESRLGGHIVQGHVDGIGVVASVRPDGEARVVRIDADAALLRYVVDKGSITVDGVSLTVSAIDDDGFEISLIPETLDRTTLGRVAAGTPVNLEVDVVAKYVEKLLVTRT
jgi:riboflavin synthase